MDTNKASALSCLDDSWIPDVNQYKDFFKGNFKKQFLLSGQ